MIRLLKSIFGCGHCRLGWPITIKRQTTVLCLDCGQRFEYDWQAMKMGAAIQREGLTI
jgi:transcription elongation factor Elf1